MGSSDGSLEAAEGSQRIPHVARLWGVFYSPRETLRDITHHPDFIFPVLINIAVVVAETEMVFAKVGVSGLMRGLRRPPKPSQTALVMRLIGISVHVIGVVGAPVGLALVAALGMLALWGYKTKISFKTAYSLAAYSWLVSLPRPVIGAVFLAFVNPEDINIRHVFPTSLAFFLPPETSAAAMRLAGALDLFGLWSLALFAVGLSEATGSRVRAFALFATVFALRAWL